MNVPVKQLQERLQAKASSSDQIDDMASYNLLQFFDVLLQVDQRLISQSSSKKGARDED